MLHLIIQGLCNFPDDFLDYWILFSAGAAYFFFFFFVKDQTVNILDFGGGVPFPLSSC